MALHGCIQMDPSAMMMGQQQMQQQQQQLQQQQAGKGMMQGGMFFKTRMCKEFRVGRCTRGEACKYAHGEPEWVAIQADRTA